MILVGQFDSPVTRRVGITLHLYGLPFTRDTRSVFGDADGIARINPLTRIPALILDDGEVLIDSAAILDHLDALAGPTRALIPPSGPERRQILQTTALAMGVFEKSVSVSYERFFHPPAHRSEAWQTRCLTQIAGGLAALEGRLASPFAHGDALTHADVLITCTIAYIRLRLPEAFPDGAHPALSALATRCETLPAFRAAAISPDETMPAT